MLEIFGRGKRLTFERAYSAQASPNKLSRN